MEHTDEREECLDRSTSCRLHCLWEFCTPMVLDLGTDDMAGCSSEEDLPDCDCDVNRQDKLKNVF